MEAEVRTCTRIYVKTVPGGKQFVLDRWDTKFSKVWGSTWVTLVRKSSAIKHLTCYVILVFTTRSLYELNCAKHIRKGG